MPEFRVRVSKKIFTAADSGFAVFKAQVFGSRETQIIVGNLVGVHEGDLLQVEGEAVEHPRFGRQFRVRRFQTLLPEDHEGIAKYLSSGRIKGIGRKTAQKIVDRFGSLTFQVLENSPEQLLHIPGLRRSVLEEVKKSVREGRAVRDLAIKLSPFGIGNETIFKIFKAFGDESLAVVEKNPYTLIGRIRGIGFKIADAVARALGGAPDDPQRIRAGILHTREQWEFQRGDLAVPENELLEQVAGFLDIPAAVVRQGIEQLEREGVLCREIVAEPVISTPLNLLVEKFSAQRLVFMQRRPPLSFLEINFESIFEKLSLELTSEQKQAVLEAARNRIAILSGGPGTGKTTIIRALMEVLKRNGRHFLIAAPTGRAAKRIEESAHTAAVTIHRLLKYNPETGQFAHHRQNPLKADTLIVDEFSMVDAFLFYYLLQALGDESQLIIIGDKDQLPSVGPGNVLRDLIQSGRFPTHYLRQNFRQTADSLIVENAHRVNSGLLPLIPAYSPEQDFVLVR